MAIPVKVSDKLMALARAESANAHRSATAQIEHWATLGRAVEVMAAYLEVLALKRIGRSVPMPTLVTADEIRERLSTLVTDDDRARVKARIAAAAPVRYTSEPTRPGRVVEIRADGTRVVGRLKGRRFVADKDGGTV
jgi:ribosomal protein L17